jgi:uncharacterized protein (TIGR01619 family)
MTSILKSLSAFFIFICVIQVSYSQEGNWDAYIATFDNGPGLVTLNMDLINSSPRKELPYIVSSTVRFKECNKDGFPENEVLDILYQIADNLKGTITKSTKSEYVGTFTIQCQRTYFFYVQDTSHLRKNIQKGFAKKYTQFTHLLLVEPDKEWKHYRQFLYPNEDILDYMSNEKVLENLKNAGDDLSKSRLVDHWFYFKNIFDRDLFLENIKETTFKVVKMEVISSEALPYQVQLAREDFVDMSSISKVTKALRHLAKKYNGKYDGWETFVIKQ